MEFEDKIKNKLRLRGFTEEQIINNRGLIGAVIDETILEVTKSADHDVFIKKGEGNNDMLRVEPGDELDPIYYYCGNDLLHTRFSDPSIVRNFFRAPMSEMKAYIRGLFEFEESVSQEEREQAIERWFNCYCVLWEDFKKKGK